MSIYGIYINGINVVREQDHYLLQKDGLQMRCDIGELNECIPEFEAYFLENRKQTA